MSIKIMLVDDHIMIREGIKNLLEFDGSMEVIEEAGDGLECLKKLNDIEPDLLILDINMPKMNGIEVLKKLGNKKSSMKTLVLTVHNEVDYLMEAIDIGADGYILKDSNLQELKYAINIIMSGESYIQPDLISALDIGMLSKEVDKKKLKTLTKRELEILALVASGMFNKEIGDKLNISERTVKNHISSIFKKISVSDRTQAAVFAIKNDIIKLY